MTYLPEDQMILGAPSGPCVDRNGDFLEFPEGFTNASTIDIPPLTLNGAPEPGLPHIFSVTVSKETNVSGWHDIRNSTTSVTISMVPGEPPLVESDGEVSQSEQESVRCACAPWWRCRR